MQRVINFFPGPGVGKSEMAMATTAALKRAGVLAEYVHEFAKDGEWEGRTGFVRECQDYIWAKQHFRMRILEGKVQVIVTDSPLLLSLYYNKNKILPSLDTTILESHRRFDNVNFFIKREKVYIKAGRSQTLPEARKADLEIEELLKKLNEPFVNMAYGHSQQAAVGFVMDYIQPLGWLEKWKDPSLQTFDPVI